jgi:putative ABC transport system substrate-binding protein
MPVIGFLAPVSQNEELLGGFREGLKQAGFVEGDNVSILYHFAENEIDRLPALASDLARRRVAVIATLSQPAVVAAKAATATIPIVFVAAEDSVRLGLVASLARPGGNLTGINFFQTELVAKRCNSPNNLCAGTLCEEVHTSQADDGRNSALSWYGGAWSRTTKTHDFRGS